MLRPRHPPEGQQHRSMTESTRRHACLLTVYQLVDKVAFNLLVSKFRQSSRAFLWTWSAPPHRGGTRQGGHPCANRPRRYHTPEWVDGRYDDDRIALCHA